MVPVAALDRERQMHSLARIRARLAEEGWGLWALEVPGVSAFCGFVGLSRVPFEASFTPAVEIGWRLDQPWWGHGYATEAATAVVGTLVVRDDSGCPEIVSFTTTLNTSSRAGHGTPRHAARSSMVTSSTRAYLRATRSARTCSTAWSATDR